MTFAQSCKKQRRSIILQWMATDFRVIDNDAIMVKQFEDITLYLN